MRPPLVKAEEAGVPLELLQSDIAQGTAVGIIVAIFANNLPEFLSINAW